MLIFSSIWALCALGIDLTWTQYSDRADLPQSKKWRDNMIDKLRRVDVDKLTPEEKAKYRALYRQLEPDMKDASHGGMLEGMDFAPWGLLLFCIVFYLYFFHDWGGGGQRLDPNAPKFQAFAKPSAEDLRTARLRRFEAPKTEGSNEQRNPAPTGGVPES